MRLLYINLPDYGPFKDLSIVFGCNHHIENRKGSVNFVVGLNGSGKSNLLRAIYDTFHSLSLEELPKFPVTIVYELIDIFNENKPATITLHRPAGPSAKAMFWRDENTFTFTKDYEWQEWVETYELSNLPASNRVPGDQLKGSGVLRKNLPYRVCAYTSGDTTPWQTMIYPDFPKDEIDSLADDDYHEQERPWAWTSIDERHEYPESVKNADRSTADDNAQRTAVNPLCMLFTEDDVRLAAVAVSIWQAALELAENTTDADKTNFRSKLLKDITGKTSVSGARRLLNELDWLWPTHAALHLNSNVADSQQTVVSNIYWVYALAEKVLQYPLNHYLAVLPLGSTAAIDPDKLTGKMNIDALTYLTGASMRNAHSGAEALCRLALGDSDLVESLWDLFLTLYNWKAFGLLEKIDLTVQRIHQSIKENDATDDSIITYDSFSDGEQMLLGRMAILLLLQGQHNSLLLLDEPETHFNDVWKREIIDILDDNVLKDTAAQVLVATHTSLALTDVFSCEITRFVKEESSISTIPVKHPTFGADPGRILLHVFGAPDTIGARAAEFLRSKLDPAKWPKEDREKLRQLIDEIGSGWPRAKLMEILEALEQNDATSNS